MLACARCSPTATQIASGSPISELPTNFADLARVRKQHSSSDDGLVTMAFAAKGQQFTTLDHTEMEFRKARANSTRRSRCTSAMDCGASKNPIDQLNSRGLLGPRTTYVHCCTLSDNEFKLMADTGGSASLSAEVELNMGHGNPAPWDASNMGCGRASRSTSVLLSAATCLRQFEF